MPAAAHPASAGERPVDAVQARSAGGRPCGRGQAEADRPAGLGRAGTDHAGHRAGRGREDHAAADLAGRRPGTWGAGVGQPRRGRPRSGHVLVVRGGRARPGRARAAVRRSGHGCGRVTGPPAGRRALRPGRADRARSRRRRRARRLPGAGGARLPRPAHRAVAPAGAGLPRRPGGAPAPAPAGRLGHRRPRGGPRCHRGRGPRGLRAARRHAVGRVRAGGAAPHGGLDGRRHADRPGRRGAARCAPAAIRRSTTAPS